MKVIKITIIILLEIEYLEVILRVLHYNYKAVNI